MRPRRSRNAIAAAAAVAVALALPAAASAGTIVSLDPVFTPAGGGAVSLKVNGLFTEVGTTPMVFAGATKLNSSAPSAGSGAAITQMSATVPAGLTASHGLLPITVHDCISQSDCTGAPVSNSVDLIITDLSIGAITPDAINVGDAPPTLTITGTGFDLLSDVTIGGIDVAETLNGATELTAQVPGSLLAQGAVVPVTVTEGLVSVTADLTINNLLPTLDALGTDSVTTGSGELVLAVTGGQFVSTSVVQVDGAPVTTAFVSAGMLSATIPAAQLATAGSLEITVATPAPGGGTSAPQTLTVEEPPSGGGTGGPTPPGIQIAGTGRMNGPGGALGRVIGRGFGRTQADSRLTVAGAAVGRAIIWRDTRIEFKVPDLPAGRYPVQVVVNGNAVTVGEYTIGPTPPAPPIANPVLAPAGGARVLFDASLALDQSGQAAAAAGRVRAQAVGVTGITAIIWRFGDGTTSRQPTVEKTYSRPGTYNASVTVVDAAGRSSTVRQPVRVTRRGVRLPPVNLSIPDRVVFDFGSATIRDEAKPTLRRLARLVKRVGRRTLIGGHTDSIGPAAYNIRLSEDRAKAVRRFLVQEGKVSPLLLAAVGFGESAPIDSNATALGRQRNRRVTLQIARSANPTRLDGRSLQINQRIATAVLLRERALRRRLAAGLTSREIQNGTFYAESFAPGVIVRGSEGAGEPPAVAPRPVAVPKLPKPRRNFPFSRRQIQVNTRISQTAVLRVNALIDRLEAGLNGGDVRTGAITTAKLAPGLSFASVRVTGTPQKATPFTVSSAPIPRLTRGRVTEADLLKDQRRSQAAIRRINILISRFNEGFSADDFAPGTLAGVDVTAG